MRPIDELDTPEIRRSQRKFVARMIVEGGYVGDDLYGRLVRTLPGGGVEFIDEAHAQMYPRQWPRDQLSHEATSWDVTTEEGRRAALARTEAILRAEGMSRDEATAPIFEAWAQGLLSEDEAIGALTALPWP